jgi:cytoskeletal protein CcmA (bactofilin family)
MRKRNRENKGLPTINMLSEHTDLDGNIKVTGDFRIDGKVKGNVSCTGKLTLGKLGIIEGDIICDSADISGVVTGDIKCNGEIHLKENASYNGNIETKKIMVDFGTNLEMSCKTVQEETDKKAFLKAKK